MGLCFLLLAIPAQAGHFENNFSAGWIVKEVVQDEPSLTTEEITLPCQVKAFGWKILAKEHRKEKRDPWYSLGDEWHRWGWKFVAHNPTNKEIEVSIAVALWSSQGFNLDKDSSGRFGNSSAYAGPALAIPPGETLVFQGVSEYNASNHKGEGKPSSVGWRVQSDSAKSK